MLQGRVDVVYEFRSLRWEELPEWFDHCASVFAGERTFDDMRQYFMNHWYNDSNRKLDGIFVAVADGRIVSTVRVFHRYMYLNGTMVSMGGIGEVSTQPEHRRKGLSSRLLEMAIRYMESSGMVISALGTGVPQHYARFGWETVPRFICEAEVEAKPDSEVRLLDWDDPQELHQVISCYDDYAVQFSGMLVRDEGYWHKWVRTEAGRAWILKEGSEVIAYLMVKQQNDPAVLLIQDFAAKRAESDCFRRLVGHAVSSYALERAKIIYQGAIQSGLDGVQIRRDEGKMYRPVGDFLNHLLKETTIAELMHRGPVALETTRYMMAPIDNF